MIRAGDYRHLVTIQQETRTSGQGSGVTVTTIATNVPCAVETLTGREAIEAAAISTTITRRIRMRMRTDVPSGAEVVWINKGVTRTLQIEAVLFPDTRNEEMHVMCGDPQA